MKADIRQSFISTDRNVAATVQPFLKWPGGKRWLADQIMRYFPTAFRQYCEPFLGGGAIFFRLRPQSGVLVDKNEELIHAYLEVKEDVEGVIARLQELAISKEEFYCMRASRPISSTEKAVRLIYLNKTAFNGMYRVNRQGEFNVPFGCKPRTLVCDAQALRAASKALQGVKLLHADFEGVMEEARKGDLIYADPPYTTRHDNNGFRRYNESIFSWEDQERLAGAAARAVARGATVVVSNAHHNELRQLYGGFRCYELRRTSCISGKSQFRGSVKEYLFVSK